MPIKPENRHRYPANWNQISKDAKERAGWRCVHPGCAAKQYSVGRWLGEVWTPHVDYAESYTQARQFAAEYAFFLFGDGPAPRGEPPVIVIVLTTAHLDHDPANCAPENLAPMCQKHHLRYDQQHHNETAYATRMAKRGNLELPL
jgi:hypothetical protein